MRKWHELRTPAGKPEVAKISFPLRPPFIVQVYCEPSIDGKDWNEMEKIYSSNIIESFSMKFGQAIYQKSEDGKCELVAIWADTSD